MSEDDMDIHLELDERAQVIAEATGRTKESVLEDLLDDGIVNLSNEEKSESLVEQLKEAAELISTVQQINQQVSDNTVLNGGVNKTEVAVETTLEGDIVDRALESVQRKAEKIKVILAVVAPILLLLTGGVGIDYFMGDDAQGSSGEEIWGCMAFDADNFNPDAEVEDGSCYWENPPCNSQWYYDEYGYTDGSNLEVRFAFQDNSECDIEHFGGHFIITLFEDGGQQDQVFIRNIDFVNGISMEYTFEDLAEGTNHYRVEFHVVECEDGSCEHGDEYYLPTSQVYYIESQDEPEECDAYLINEQAYLLESDSEQDAVRISADVDLVDEAENCDDEQFEITWALYQDSVVKYEHQTFEDGKVTDPDGADYTTHTWDGVEDGNYEPKIVLRLNGEVLDEKWIAHTISIEPEKIWGCTDSEATNFSPEATDDDGSCEYPPAEPCEVEIHNHYRGHIAEDEEQDAIVVAFKLVPENCEDETILVEIDLFQNGYAANYTWETMVSGDNEVDVSHIFDGVAVGNSWIPMITITHDGNQLEQVNFWGIDVVAPEPEACEINLYYIMLQTNSTHATVAYDLDCGYQENELEGYNVSVQFLVYDINSSNNTDQPLVWDTTLNYVQGWEYDNNSLSLTNFTSNNTTHYDFYWYATWTDENGDVQFIERKWLNRELSS